MAKPICFMRPPELDAKFEDEKPPGTGAHPMRDAEPMTGAERVLARMEEEKPLAAGAHPMSDAEPMTDAERMVARILACVLVTALGPAVVLGWPRIAGAVLGNGFGRAHVICYICVALASLAFSMTYSAYATFRIGKMYPAEFTGVGLAVTIVCALFSGVVLVLFILLLMFLFTHPIVVI
jgi:hypothetical protein